MRGRKAKRVLIPRPPTGDGGPGVGLANSLPLWSVRTPGREDSRRRQQLPVRTAALLLATALLFTAGAFPLAARSLLGAETEQLLVDAVEAAADLDLYYARCRRDLSGRRTDNLNKELAGRFRMTVLEVEDDLFPERSYRRAKERLQRDFLEILKRAGGCKGAKKAEMPVRLRERYDRLMREIEALP